MPSTQLNPATSTYHTHHTIEQQRARSTQSTQQLAVTDRTADLSQLASRLTHSSHQATLEQVTASRPAPGTVPPLTARFDKTLDTKGAASQHPVVQDLMTFLEDSPTAWHAVEETKKRLTSDGFGELKENVAWDLTPGGKYFVTRNGSSIIAFVVRRCIMRHT